MCDHVSSTNGELQAPKGRVAWIEQTGMIYTTAPGIS